MERPDTFTKHWYETMATREKDARLIAAAPDLLAVLKSLIENDGRILGVNLGALKPMVERAIAKAEGVS